MEVDHLKNHLSGQTSPYLLQHAENPVDWYPWSDEAFEKARREDKPIFLSIGYSTCHWCHVMAHESFEDENVAGILNRAFVAIKVDKEERPDIDSIYMSVCQALTGSGGWPTSIFMTPEQKPFYAGTYFPKNSRSGMIGFTQLLLAIEAKWHTNRTELLHSAEQIVAALQPQEHAEPGELDESLVDTALALFRQSFDRTYGGFGDAPKFPTPHNLLFLMDVFQRTGDAQALEMAEITLRQMYRGGLFDHVGYGFSRYSTDRFYLTPHFEKMLYDNALLMMAYAKAYEMTKKPLYQRVAEQTAQYVLRELTGPEGEFYCAQDADSDGVEGKYYLFTPEEVIQVLGEEAGGRFNSRYDITQQGNFEGKNIPNLLKSGEEREDASAELEKLRVYRCGRTRLHLDDKVLTAWNGLMIAAFARLYRISGNQQYLMAAERAEEFLAVHLCRGDCVLVSYRDGKQGVAGFLDDYAFYIFALLELYGAAMSERYLERARSLTETVLKNFTHGTGGFSLSGKENEQLVFSPRETYDGAIPSGNSAMAHNLVRLYALTGEERYGDLAKELLTALSAQAARYPAGYCFYLLALARYLHPPRHTTAVLQAEADRELLKGRFGVDEDLTVLEKPTQAYTLLHGKTTFYICENGSCRPPVNELLK